MGRYLLEFLLVWSAPPQSTHNTGKSKQGPPSCLFAKKGFVLAQQSALPRIRPASINQRLLRVHHFQRVC